MTKVTPWLQGTSSNIIFSFDLFVCFFFHFTGSLGSRSKSVFLNEWAVEIKDGNITADQIASDYGLINHGKILPNENFYLFSHPRLKRRSLRSSHAVDSIIEGHKNVKWTQQQHSKHRFKRNILNFNATLTPNDARWSRMWYLLPSTLPSMRIKEAWIAGFTGQNVTITILDDGLDRTHPDLRNNYDPNSSFDINGNDSDPSPRSTPDNLNQHGTRCAGVAAAVGNNGLCVIGAAFRAKVGGIRMLDGQVTDAVEGRALSFNSNYVDIYSASWGPDDGGMAVEGPGRLASKAFTNGVLKGRNGKGSIFVWASGNGGQHDDCNCDGYSSSIYTISVSSVTQSRLVPWYTEMCSSTLASTYSSGSMDDGKIITTDLNSRCTVDFTGTSASAPMAAGICALALEANSNLTWRDVQHLVVQTARPDQLRADDWVVNGAKRRVSHALGFGLMDAYAMTMKAKHWEPAPPQRRCGKPVVTDNRGAREIPQNTTFVIPVEFRGCGSSGVIDRAEHVQAILTLRAKRRGDLAIFLTSPMRTKSRLLKHRSEDFSKKGFTNWTFMTTHSWDEDPRGVWQLEIQQNGLEDKAALLWYFELVVYGTLQADWSESQRVNLANPETSTSDVNPLANETASSASPQSRHALPLRSHVTNSDSSSRNKNCAIPNQLHSKCLGGGSASIAPLGAFTTLAFAFTTFFCSR